MVLADWAVACGHADPFAAWRGRYRSEADWMAIVQPAGGMATLVRQELQRAGLAGANGVRRGIVGVIGSPANPLRQWGAIHDGTCWQVRGLAGFGPLTAPVLGMWSV